MAYDQPFQKITEACKTTGLSAYYLRKGCKAGTIPHIKSGGVYYINIPALLQKMGITSPLEEKRTGRNLFHIKTSPLIDLSCNR